jgi:orotate phosphoribosyltransferase
MTVEQGTTCAVGREEALALLTSCGSLLEGHFLLSSGLHSPQYFQCARVMEDPAVGEKVAAAVAREWRAAKPQVVVAPALGALLFGYELARQLGCRNVFAERPPGGKFELRRGFEVRPGERVLLAENVITTGGSVLEVAGLLASIGADVLGYAAIVDRSSGRFAPAKPVVAYAAMQAATHPPEDCPLCAAGVPLIKPGSRAIA